MQYAVATYVRSTFLCRLSNDSQVYRQLRGIRINPGHELCINREWLIIEGQCTRKSAFNTIDRASIWMANRGTTKNDLVNFELSRQQALDIGLRSKWFLSMYYDFNFIQRLRNTFRKVPNKWALCLDRERSITSRFDIFSVYVKLVMFLLIGKKCFDIHGNRRWFVLPIGVQPQL